MSRVVWTREEKLALLACMTDIYYVTPTMSSKGLLRHAQEEVLPYERRLKITDQRVFNYKALIAQAKADAEKHRSKVAGKPKDPEPPKTVTPPPEQAPPTVGELFEQLVDAVTKQVLRQVMQHMQPMVERTMTMEELDQTFDRLYPEWKKAQAEVTPTATLPGDWLNKLDKLSIRKEVKAKRPTALVVGLLGVQMECIKQSNPGVDFTFVTAEQAVSHYTINKDHTFLMTKFINHSVQNKYRKHPNLHFVNGGVTELKTLLHGIFYKQEAA